MAMDPSDAQLSTEETVSARDPGCRQNARTYAKLASALFRLQIVLTAGLVLPSCRPPPQPALVKGPCDLSCPPVVHEPASVHVGDAVTFTYAVSNAGPGSAPGGRYELEFYVDGRLIGGDQRTSTIPPGRAVVYSKMPGAFHFRAGTTGEHNYMVVADPKHTLKETDESNNVRRGRFHVSE